ncbi:MAG: hypothetical protein ABL971_06210 [Vicinamibacterales bacterium]
MVTLVEEGQWEDCFRSALRRDGVALTCRRDGAALGYEACPGDALPRVE